MDLIIKIVESSVNQIKFLHERGVLYPELAIRITEDNCSLIKSIAEHMEEEGGN